MRVVRVYVEGVFEGYKGRGRHPRVCGTRYLADAACTFEGNEFTINMRLVGDGNDLPNPLRGSILGARPCIAPHH